MLVCKFGGSSLADAEQFKKVKEIILADKNRRYVIPSAPGKRGDGDEKVTDLLYEAAAARQVGSPFLHILERIRYRYERIAQDLQLDVPLEAEFTKIASTMMTGASRDYAASRGEYLNGLLLAEYLGFPFTARTRKGTSTPSPAAAAIFPARWSPARSTRTYTKTGRTSPASAWRTRASSRTPSISPA